MTRRWSLPVAALCAAVFWAGCGSTDDAAPPEPSVAVDTTPTTTATDDAPETAVFTMDDHIGWLLGVLDTGEFDQAETTERFHPSFLAEVPVVALNAPLGQIAPPGSAPWRVLDDTGDGQVAEITVESADGTRLTITLALATAEPHQIEGLLLQPADTDLPEGYTLAQLDADIAAFAPQAALGIYDVTNGNCDADHEHNGDQPLAIGSIFKLWVLAALANQIQLGTADWNEPLVVRADLRSNPAGQVYQLADGDTLTMRQYAEAMISISDNTATDHLIDRLGRQAIEAAMARAGVARPALNQPLPATRELFWLKYLAEPPNPPDWYNADTDGRRAILDDLDGKIVPGSWTPPLRPRRTPKAYLEPSPATSTSNGWPRQTTCAGHSCISTSWRRRRASNPWPTFCRSTPAWNSTTPPGPTSGSRAAPSRGSSPSHGGSSAMTADNSSSRAYSTTPMPPSTNSPPPTSSARQSISSEAAPAATTGRPLLTESDWCNLGAHPIGPSQPPSGSLRAAWRRRCAALPVSTDNRAARRRRW